MKIMLTDEEMTLVRAVSLIACHFKHVDKAVNWFKTRNALLGGRAPLALHIAGKSDKLLKFIEEQLGSNRPV